MTKKRYAELMATFDGDGWKQINGMPQPTYSADKVRAILDKALAQFEHVGFQTYVEDVGWCAASQLTYLQQIQNGDPARKIYSPLIEAAPKPEGEKP